MAPWRGRGPGNNRGSRASRLGCASLSRSRARAGRWRCASWRAPRDCRRARRTAISSACAAPAWCARTGRTGTTTSALAPSSSASRRSGAWMNRGTIISLKPMPLMPTFILNCAMTPTFVNIYAQHLKKFGIRLPCAGVEGVYHRYAGDTAVSDAWMYNGLYVGPTLLAEPGDLLDLTLVNNLEPPSNLHTHGLHVSPIGNSDNVLLNIVELEANHFQIQIPSDHPHGLNWYHPHRHETASNQIIRGLSGLGQPAPPRPAVRPRARCCPPRATVLMCGACSSPGSRPTRLRATAAAPSPFATATAICVTTAETRWDAVEGLKRFGRARQRASARGTTNTEMGARTRGPCFFLRQMAVPREGITQQCRRCDPGKPVRSSDRSRT